MAKALKVIVKGEDGKQQAFKATAASDLLPHVLLEFGPGNVKDEEGTVLTPGYGALTAGTYTWTPARAVADAGTDDEAEIEAGPAAIVDPACMYQLRSVGGLSPSKFGKVWPDFQQNPLTQPLFNCLRPASAKGTPAALMDRVFGVFLEDAKSVQLDQHTCQIVLDLITSMSMSYLNTTTKEARKITQAQFGPSFRGEDRGSEAKRAETIRKSLSALLNALNAKGSIAEKDGSVRVYNALGVVVAHALIMEIKEDWGKGGGSHPVMQLMFSYALNLLEQLDKSSLVALNTCQPALGLEVYANSIRVHALYYTDRVCCEPLTPTLHLSDMRWSVEAYTEQVARALKAVVLGVCNLVQVYKDAEAAAGAGAGTGGGSAVRDARLESGLPYMLRDGRFTQVERLVERNHVYLCRVASAAGGEESRVVKVVLGPYPAALHVELGEKGVMPRLLSKEEFPGGYTLVEMEYLDPAEGWRRLDAWDDAELDAAAAAALVGECERALRGLQECLDNTALHGDLRGCNIQARPEEPSTRTSALDEDVDQDKKPAGGSGPEVEFQVKLIDVDWGGSCIGSRPPRYPAFINHKASWPIPDPTEQLITQEHDVKMMDACLARFRQRMRPEACAAGRATAGGRASKRAAAVARPCRASVAFAGRRRGASRALAGFM